MEGKKRLGRYLLLALLFVLTLTACNAPSNREEVLAAQVEELNKKLEKAYEPGWGILMNNIQIHHSKLWFAGTNANWALAQFEIHELEERFEDLEKYQGESEEAKLIPIVTPALDSINKAIDKKSIPEFQASYSFLTQSCNKCHSAAKHDFIKIKIPDAEFYYNQEFIRAD